MDVVVSGLLVTVGALASALAIWAFFFRTPAQSRGTLLDSKGRSTATRSSSVLSSSSAPITERSCGCACG